MYSTPRAQQKGVSYGTNMLCVCLAWPGAQPPAAASPPPGSCYAPCRPPSDGYGFLSAAGAIQMRTVLSSLAEASMWRLRGFQLTALTVPVWPSSLSRHSPLCRCHTYTCGSRSRAGRWQQPYSQVASTCKRGGSAGAGRHAGGGKRMLLACKRACHHAAPHLCILTAVHHKGIVAAAKGAAQHEAALPPL